MSQFKELLNQFKLDYKPYEEMYKDLHQHPELGTTEEYTSGVAAKHLEKLGYKVVSKIGGHGVIGILQNGEGKTVLCRADMDALPVKENTGVEYASTRTQVDPETGTKKAVMHACGHDFHVTCALAAADTLASAKDRWSGTVVILIQPDEEGGAGARAMVDDGLYTKHGCPVPDVVLGQHVIPGEAGNVYTQTGATLSSSDSFTITFHGKSSHSSQPSSGINPVTIACQAALRIQMITAVEVPATENAVVTVTSIQGGGDAHNIIPDTAVMKLNVRTKNEQVRANIKAAIERIAHAEALSNGDEASAEVVLDLGTPVLMNDDGLYHQLSESFAGVFGDAHSDQGYPIMASEDFQELALAVDKPAAYWFIGGLSKDQLGKFFNHSSKFAPVIQPTVKTGHDAMVAGVLTFLQN